VKNYQLIIKLHPFDENHVYDFLDKYKNVVVIKTNKPEKGDQDSWIPTYESIYLNRDLLYHSDLNINIFSTITLESLFLNKPVINIAFEVDGQTNPIPTELYYQCEHFKPITDSGATTIVYSMSELYDAVVLYSKNPSHCQEKRILLASKYRPLDSITSVDAICKFICNLAPSHEY
jgi:hypothetical protein